MSRTVTACEMAVLDQFNIDRSCGTVTRDIYEVGGAVRDFLLGVEPSDIDYVAVGYTQDYFLSKGFKQVGLDFPVFLDPNTGCEVALARIDRKMSRGYCGFEVDTSNVSLEDDLKRRDLTINSMARSSSGSIIDPFGGQSDLSKKILRHTSEAFVEDPIRVLRLARFRARLCADGSYWKIDYGTKALVYSMRDELMFLQRDRVWKEVQKALSTTKFYVFLETLFELGVLDIIFPHIYQLTTLKEGSKHHMEASLFDHTIRMLKLYEDTYAIEYQTHVMKLSILYHDIAKPYCYRTLGSSAGHDSVDLISEFIDMYLPVKLYQQVLFNTKNHVLVYRTYEMSAKRIATFLEQFKSVEQLLTLLQLASFDSRGRINIGVEKDIEHNMLLRALTNILAYSPVEWISSKDSRPSGEAIKNHIHKVNIAFVNEAIDCCRARDMEE